MSKTKLANIFDNLSFVSYILFLTDDLIIKIGNKDLQRFKRFLHIPHILLIVYIPSTIDFKCGVSN